MHRRTRTVQHARIQAAITGFDRHPRPTMESSARFAFALHTRFVYPSRLIFLSNSIHPSIHPLQTKQLNSKEGRESKVTGHNDDDNDVDMISIMTRTTTPLHDGCCNNRRTVSTHSPLEMDGAWALLEYLPAA